MNEVVFIGAINCNHPPKDGETAKNQVLLEFLKENYHVSEVIDTFNWKKSPKTLFKLIRCCLFRRKNPIIVSASTGSVYQFSRLIYHLNASGHYYYFVIGNTILRWVDEGKLKTKYLKQYLKIYVEGKSTREVLLNKGLINVEYLPNFRRIYEMSVESRINRISESDKIHFVFLSRIMEEKGVSIIFNAMKNLNDLGLEPKYDVTFYGTVKNNYEQIFRKRIDETKNALYGGYLNLQTYAGYEELSGYHAMLFPTFWHGEGFPGVLLDSFIAGVPVIASDWSINSEIIKNEFNGLLIKSRDEDELNNAMRYFITNPHMVSEMSKNCLHDVEQYNYQNVLSRLRDQL